MMPWMMMTMMMMISFLTAAFLAQLVDRPPDKREVVSSNVGRTKENVLPLLWHLQIVRHSFILK